MTGAVYGQTDSEKDDAIYEKLDLFVRVLENVRERYVEAPDEEKLIDAAIEGMLSSLDPHSALLDKEEMEDITTINRGTFGGIGLELSYRDRELVVVSPIDGTPAFRAGLQPGDVILAGDDVSFEDMSLSQAVSLLRGEVGTSITISIARDGGAPFEVTLVRESITLPSVWFQRIDGVGIIRISNFTGQTTVGLHDAIKSLRETTNDQPPLVGLVIDLRNNPGGLLEQAISVSDTFLSRGEIVSIRDRRSGKRYNATRGDMTDGLPLVIIINAGSASASEIVAGALQDHQRALILGTRSFGKGSVQSLFDLPPSHAIKLTSARYYTPSGRSIQALGVSPDIEIQEATLVEDEHSDLREADLTGALSQERGDERDESARDETQDEPSTSEDKDSQEDSSQDNNALPQNSALRALDNIYDPQTDYQLKIALQILQSNAILSAAP
ncbi:MAG: S41 family peptidase [Pseudomonadota bacterium]